MVMMASIASLDPKEKEVSQVQRVHMVHEGRPANPEDQGFAVLQGRRVEVEFPIAAIDK